MASMLGRAVSSGSGRPVLDAPFQDGSGPTLPDGVVGVPLALEIAGNSRQQGDEMKPRQLDSRLLPNSEIGAHLREILHVFQMATGEPLHFREGFLEVGRQAIDDPGPPALPVLALQNLRADPVIQPHPLPVRGERRPYRIEIRRPGKAPVRLRYPDPTPEAPPRGDRRSRTCRTPRL